VTHTDEEREIVARQMPEPDPYVAALLRLLEAARAERDAAAQSNNGWCAEEYRQRTRAEKAEAERDADRAQVVELRAIAEEALRMWALDQAGAFRGGFDLSARLAALDAKPTAPAADLSLLRGNNAVLLDIAQEAVESYARRAVGCEVVRAQELQEKLAALPTTPTPDVEQSGACKCDVPNTSKEVRLLKPCAHCGQLATQPVETPGGPMHTVCAMRTQPAGEIAKSLGARIRLCCLDRFTGGDADRASAVLDIIRNLGREA
jgi:hypothetical protein